MGLFESLLGGGQQRQEFDDFANRYDQGAPWDGISDDEAYNRYQQVAPHLPPDVYQQSAEQSFSRLSPQQRMEFGRYLRQRSQQQGFQVPGLDMEDRYEDPRHLASVTSQLDQQQPGILGQLLGGGGGGGGMGGMLSNPIGKAALSGIAAMAVRQMSGRR